MQEDAKSEHMLPGSSHSSAELSQRAAKDVAELESFMDQKSTAVDTDTKPKKIRRFPVIEMFGPTIQGEGIVAGTKTMFIRFGGCDYRCTKCDSLHAVMPEAIKKHSTPLTAEEIALKMFEAKHKTGVEWVTLSGGNPCMWQLEELCILLKTAGMKIAVETQGTLKPNWLKHANVVTVSPKSPGMGEEFEPQVFKKFLDHLIGWGVPVSPKVVIFSAQDIDFALEVGAICEEYGVNRNGLYLSLGNPYPPVLDKDFSLQPTNPDLDPSSNLKLMLLSNYKVLAEEILNDPRLVEWRFLPQLHVLVWGNEAGF